MIDFDKMEKDVKCSDILKIIDEAMGKPCTFENKGIKARDSEKITTREFRNLTFINCCFDFTLRNCRIVDCHFIDCRFYDCSIFYNLVENTEISNVEFANNTDVMFNVFDGLIGFLSENQWCLHNQNNVFKNMDFSGFLPLYTYSDFGKCDIVCGKNFFRNTTVSLEAIEKLSSRANFFASTRDDSVPDNLIRVITNDIDEEGKKSIKDKLVIKEYFVPNLFLIDLRNMNPEEKLNLVASIATNIYNGSYLGVSLNYRNLNDSLYTFYSTPNPMPLRIVDSRGFSLKEGVIRDIGIKKYWALENMDPCLFDGNAIDDKAYRLYIYNEKINRYTDDNSLHNPSNYEPFQKTKK